MSRLRLPGRSAANDDLGRSAAEGGYEERSYWQATMPQLPDRSSEPVPERADVVVVGGGYTGVTTALRLSRAGARVVLVEAETLGWGASTRNGGMFHAGLKWGGETLRRRYGQELGERLHREGNQAFGIVEQLIGDESIDCDYRRSGQVVLAWSGRDAAAFDEDASSSTAEGYPAHVVRGASLRDEIGTDQYEAGLVEEMAGGLHPGRFLAGLATRAAEAGATICERAPAVALERSSGTITVRTPRGAVRAGEVVLATNGYTGGLVPWIRQRVIPIGSYIVVTEPLDPAVAAEISPRGRMFFDTKNFLYYWRLTSDGRLLFGGRASFAPTTVGRTAAILSSAMRTVHPQVEAARLDYAWGGLVGFTFDRLPHIGRRDGVTYALGYCGSGVCMATYFGTVVAAGLGRGTEVATATSAFEEIPHPGAPVAPWAYRGRPWFLPVVGEAFRLQDRLARRGHRPATAAVGAGALASERAALGSARRDDSPEA